MLRLPLQYSDADDTRRKRSVPATQSALQKNSDATLTNAGRHTAGHTPAREQKYVCVDALHSTKRAACCMQPARCCMAAAASRHQAAHRMRHWNVLSCGGAYGCVHAATAAGMPLLCTPARMRQHTARMRKQHSVHAPTAAGSITLQWARAALMHWPTCTSRMAGTPHKLPTWQQQQQLCNAAWQHDRHERRATALPYPAVA